MVECARNETQRPFAVHAGESQVRVRWTFTRASQREKIRTKTSLLKNGTFVGYGTGLHLFETQRPFALHSGGSRVGVSRTFTTVRRFQGILGNI